MGHALLSPEKQYAPSPGGGRRIAKRRLSALTLSLPTAIPNIHRLPPVRGTDREEVGIGFNLVAVRQKAVTDGWPNTIEDWCLIAVHASWRPSYAWALIAVDTYVIERPAA